MAAAVVWIALLLPLREAIDRIGPVSFTSIIGLFTVLFGVGLTMTLKTPPRSRSLTLVLASSAMLMLALAAGAHANQTWLRSGIARLFGPTAVHSQEAYERRDDGPTFDHSTFNMLLAAHVDEHGWIDYKGFKRDRAALAKYIAAIAKAPFDDLDRDEKLALLINGYNAFTIQLIIEYLPVDSIRDIPAAKRWDAKRWNVGGRVWSLNQIEHEQIRPKFKEPRIHFALVCAAESCPPLRSEAYVAARLEQQLQEQTKYAHTHARWLRVDSDANTVHLTELYNWYGNDFKSDDQTILTYSAQFSKPMTLLLERVPNPRIKWIPYSWKLNSVDNRPDQDKK